MKKRLLNLILVVVLILAILPAITILPVVTQNYTASAINPLSGYDAYKSVVINHTDDGAQTNYQMQLTIIRGMPGSYANTGGAITTVGANSIHTFTADGYFYACKTGIIKVECWGAGGGGGYYWSYGGGGGGGGAYAATSNVAVVAGTAYEIVRGTGGARDTAGVAASSTFATTTVVALGGAGVNSNTGGAGGVGASGTGTTKYSGGAGNNSHTTGDVGGGGGGAGGPDGAGQNGVVAVANIGGAGGAGDAGLGGAGGRSDLGENGAGNSLGGGGGSGNGADSGLGGNGGLPGGGGAGTDDSGAGATGANGQVVITCVTADYLGGDAGGIVYAENKCTNWPNDVRFTKSDGTTLLDFWREESDATDGTWWIEVDSIPAHPDDATIYVHVGDADAADASSGANTFPILWNSGSTVVGWTAVTWTGYTAPGGWASTGGKIRGTLSAGAVTQGGWLFCDTQTGTNSYKLHVTMQRTSGGADGRDQTGITIKTTQAAATAGRIGWIQVSGPDYWFIEDQDGGSNSGAVGANVFNASNAHNYLLTRDASTEKLYVDSLLKVTHTKTSWSPQYIGLMVFAVENFTVDWSDIFVANFTTNEPTWGAWGSWGYLVTSVYLTTSSGVGGNVSTPGEGTYAYNVSEIVNISATADYHFKFVNWTGSTANISNVNASSTTINMSSSNQSAVANFTAFVLSISNTPDSKVFGFMLESTSYWSNGSAPIFALNDSQCFFAVTNNGDIASITINATNFTGGVGWALNASVDVDKVVMKAGKSGDANEAAMIVLNSSPQVFISSLAASATKKWEIKLSTGTFTDGVTKNGSIILTGVLD
jgi:hypothetical protein